MVVLVFYYNGMNHLSYISERCTKPSGFFFEKGPIDIISVDESLCKETTV